MLASNHCFEDIEEKVMVFIPGRDIRSLWRVTTFKYLDGAWEWVQVTSDHVASHYTMLAIQCAAKLVILVKGSAQQLKAVRDKGGIKH